MAQITCLKDIDMAKFESKYLPNGPMPHASWQTLDGKRSLDRISVDRNCVLSLDRNFVNHLTEFHLTESVDRNFNNVILSYFKLSIKCQNP
jgi:hypothetical protein